MNIKSLSLLSLFAIGATLFAAAPKGATPAPAPEKAIATEGATPGAWTMDAEAALKLAKEQNKVILLNFTGSDWCGWCKLMDRKVFSQAAWQAYAKEHLVLVWVDFPKDKGLVPKDRAQKNKALAAQYEVQGYPTYIVLSPEGKEIGRLGADREATPESFIADLEERLVLQKLDTLLSPEEFAAYEALKTQLKGIYDEAKAWQEKIRQEGEAFQARVTAVEEQLEAYIEKARKAAKP